MVEVRRVLVNVVVSSLSGKSRSGVRRDVGSPWRRKRRRPRRTKTRWPAARNPTRRRAGSPPAERDGSSARGVMTRRRRRKKRKRRSRYEARAKGPFSATAGGSSVIGGITRQGWGEAPAGRSGVGLERGRTEAGSNRCRGDPIRGPFPSAVTGRGKSRTGPVQFNTADRGPGTLITSLCVWS